ncbi:MAG: glucokinase [Pseudomonadota bacterium]
MTSQSTTETILVADIGGTHARFALAAVSEGGVTLRDARHFACANASGVAALLTGYLTGLNADRPRRACLASAGPGDHQQRHLTNLDWDLNADELAAAAKLDQVLLVNDFEALARGAITPGCRKHTLAAGTAVLDAPVAVIGPGTGLGAAYVVPSQQRPHCIATEAAHMAFRPSDGVERSLLEALTATHGYVFNELVLSGPGLERLHALLHGLSTSTSAAEISAGALKGDEDCMASVRRFLAMLGSVAGDLALAQGARGGVLLGGGILPRWAELLPDSAFLQRFYDKGVMSDYMRAIPVSLITDTGIAERGAALLLLERG